jgi:CheY-like chemotaxis protein
LANVAEPRYAPRAVRAVVYRYGGLDSLQDELACLQGDGDLPLPDDLESPHDGEWVLATFCVGAIGDGDSISLAARIGDGGAGLRVRLEPRDRVTLERFIRGEGPASSPPTDRSGELQTPSGTRVLIVQPDDDVRQIVCGFLEDGGFVPVTVGSTQDAAALLNSGSVRAVVMDADLPAICGLEFCRGLRHSGCCVPVLILATDESRSSVQAILDAGADDLLTKPFRAPELRARLHGLLQRAC